MSSCAFCATATDGGNYCGQCGQPLAPRGRVASVLPATAHPRSPRSRWLGPLTLGAVLIAAGTALVWASSAASSQLPEVVPQVPAAETVAGPPPLTQSSQAVPSPTTSPAVAVQSAQQLRAHGELITIATLEVGDPESSWCAADGAVLKVMGDDGMVVGATKLGNAPRAGGTGACQYHFDFPVDESVTYRFQLDNDWLELMDREVLGPDLKEAQILSAI